MPRLLIDTISQTCRNICVTSASERCQSAGPSSAQDLFKQLATSQSDDLQCCGMVMLHLAFRRPVPL